MCIRDRDRISKRTDITGMLVHLTKPNESYFNSIDEEKINLRAVDILISILEDSIIEGSTTESGFIVGENPAVCFQGVPLSSITQNIKYEQEKREEGLKKIRYCGIGLAFNKCYVFDNGGRPVFYEQTEKAKNILPEEEHWRIVNTNLPISGPNIIDWTHEREWRIPGNFEFKRKWAHVILYDKMCWDYFHEKCPDNIIEEIFGITILKGILM